MGSVGRDPGRVARVIFAGSSAYRRRGHLCLLLKIGCRWFDSAPGHHPQFFEVQEFFGITGGPSVRGGAGNRPTIGLYMDAARFGR